MPWSRLHIWCSFVPTVHAKLRWLLYPPIVYPVCCQTFPVHINLDFSVPGCQAIHHSFSRSSPASFLLQCSRCTTYASFPRLMTCPENVDFLLLIRATSHLCKLVSLKTSSFCFYLCIVFSSFFCNNYTVTKYWTYNLPNRKHIKPTSGIDCDIL